MAEAPITANSSTEASIQSIASAPASISSERKKTGESSTLADELAKLEKLHASGALTDAEFDQAKHKLLKDQ